LGLKLACGFQILCNRNGKTEADVKEESAPKGPKWEKFLACLTEQGYFKGEVEGSKLYQDLLKKAQQQFHEYFAVENRSDPGEIILGILKDAKIDVEKMREKELLPEDDESWLNLSEQDLDSILSKYSDPNSRHKGTENGTLSGGNTVESDGTPLDLDSVTRCLKSFVDKVSSYEGAEFPGEGENDDIQFDADSFMDTVGSLLGRGARSRDEDSETDSDDEDLMTSSDEENGPEEGVQRSTVPSGEDKEMKSYMDQMDEELARTSIGESFEKKDASSFKASSQGTHQSRQDNLTNATREDDEDAPVDVDFNLVKNILESFSTQQGLAGPASNILNSMGVWLPPNTDLTDST